LKFPETAKEKFGEILAVKARADAMQINRRTPVEI
jgi:hypothetical protein